MFHLQLSIVLVLYHVHFLNIWNCINVLNIQIYHSIILKDFLESEGIVVEEPKQIPSDPYITKRAEAAALRTYDTPSAFDKLKQFKELDRKVLRFFCMWDDRDNMFGEMRPFVIHVSNLFLLILIFFLTKCTKFVMIFFLFHENIYFHLFTLK